MNVLNLYCGLGGNRKKWKNVKVTAVEHNKEIAALYKKYFPDDDVIVGDAHEFLLKNYSRFDFIWTSPPCPTHSRSRYWRSKGGDLEPKFPDWRLWQEILFLKHHAKGKYVAENVIPYYEEDMNIFLPPTVKIQRHLFWANFKIKKYEFEKTQMPTDVKPTDTVFGFNLSAEKIKHRKDQILRNLVDPDIGEYILEQAEGFYRKQNINQIEIF